MRAVMLSNEFLERFEAGQRIFENIELQYADMSRHNFSGLHLRNSSLFFTTCRHCNFENAIFDDCRMFFAGFRGSDFKNVKIINCQIEYSGLSVLGNNTKIINSQISWTDMIDAAGVELENCSIFRVFRNLSEFTETTARQALQNLQPIINQLDFDMQEKVRNLLSTITEEYKMEIPKISTEKEHDSYGRQKTTNKNYNVFDALLDNAITTYGTKAIYKSENIKYRTDSGYKH